MKNQNENNPQKPKRGRKKILLLGLGALGLGLLTFFSVQFWNKQKKTSGSQTNPAPENPSDNKAQTKAPGSAGSKSSSSKTRQGKTSTQNNAKQSASPKPQKPINATMLAKALHSTISKKDYSKSLLLLKAIKNTKDYSAVNKVFEKYLLNGVRQTLVTALLNTYTLELQRQMLRKSFLSMGLKYDGKKWTLSGAENSEILLITTRPTKVYKNPNSGVKVPENMVLGRQVTKRGQHTLFETDNQLFLVESNAVKEYQPK